ncbi:hypothetical protein JTB14_013811 [Gonioctena quinquepunctata]|nr:hypothetical protein JTB14_013811 [Gonioctena quinquepunctata]
MERICNRKIRSSTLEHNDPEIRKWFKRLFELLEGDAAMEQHKRISLLREVFPRGVLEQVISIITLKSRADGVLPDGSTGYKTKTASVYRFPSSLSIDSQESSREVYKVSRDERSQLSAKDVRPDRAARRLFDYRKCIHPNPYIAFFRKKSILARIWKDVPLLFQEKLSLREKADVISNRIAGEFINWLRENNLLADALHVKSLIEMFELANEVNVSLKVCQEECFTVSESVVQFLEDTSRGKSERLRKEIRRDYKASFMKPRKVAFGSTIPHHLQRKPADRKQLGEWMKRGRIPKELESMEVVWDKIYHLKSTREFCHFLNNKYPSVPPPKCLLESGMMDPNLRSSRLVG